MDILGVLGNGFPLDKVNKDQTAFLMGGGIGVPPILELAKQLDCNKKIIVGYRDSSCFLREDFEKNGDLYIATEDGSVGTAGNVMDAIRENALKADIIYACGPMPMLRAIKAYALEADIPARKMWTHIPMCIMPASARTALYLKPEKWKSEKGAFSPPDTKCAKAHR